MAINLIDANTTAAITANISGDTWIVAEGVYVTTTGDAIDGSGVNGEKTFHIDGHVISDNGSAIFLGDPATGTGGRNEVFISASATLGGGDNAIESHGGFLVVTNLGSISSAGERGIRAEDGANTINNGGTISALKNGITVLGGFSNVHNTGMIAAGLAAIFAGEGDNRISNTGSMTAGGTGIQADGGGNVVSNDGSISADTNGFSIKGDKNAVTNNGSVDVKGLRSDVLFGVGLNFSDGTDNLFLNTGTVILGQGVGMAVRIGSAAGEANTVINEGTLTAPVTAVRGLDGDERVVNRGSINGEIDLGGGADTVANAGSVASDVLLGEGEDRYNGRGGEVDGSVLGEAGSDTLVGGAGHDSLSGGLDNDRLGGQGGDDELDGGSGADTLSGHAGEDSLNGSGDNDSLAGGAGDDELNGGLAPDTLAGGGDDDVLTGFNGNDTLNGGAGNDTILAGIGFDTLNGGRGDDLLNGGIGGDHFVFLAGSGRDTIAGFTNDVDTLRLDRAGFGLANVNDALAKAQVFGNDVVFTFDTGDVVIVDAFAGALADLANDIALV